MAKVANRVRSNRSSSEVKAVPTVKTKSGKVLTTKIEADTSFTELRELNQQILRNLRH
ncbi:hypothetical protein [Paenibacillus hunanensis]|uniref:YfhD family protein n=1 Tax=Paenibacillus hunanensis TaxID=539262 RepID=A0ABU1J3W1_9BACL|nr:hypothetical protein [Paenibacillus hunanensis]MDR6246195.1 hypothetical protein [Paenibacillus hunanensis]GGJ29513.1 hypothetical protein GCM10008022_42910 [Paenibacillus hunanensis]